MSPRRFRLEVRRRSSGPKQSCWQPARELGRSAALWLETPSAWTPATVSELVEAAARRLPPTSGPGRYCASLRVPGCSGARRICHELHVTRGRWRVQVLLGYGDDIAPAALDAFEALATRTPTRSQEVSDDLVR